jgi:hypothetical protein
VRDTIVARMKLRSLAALGLAFTALGSSAAAAKPAAGMGAQSPAAHIAALCSVGTGEGYNGYAYLLTLSIKGATCATGMTRKSGVRRVLYTYVVNT